MQRLTSVRWTVCVCQITPGSLACLSLHARLMSDFVPMSEVDLSGIEVPMSAFREVTDVSDVMNKARMQLLCVSMTLTS